MGEALWRAVDDVATDAVTFREDFSVVIARQVNGSDPPGTATAVFVPGEANEQRVASTGAAAVLVRMHPYE